MLRRISIYAACSLALVGLGVGIGRFLTPPKVVTKVETRVETRVVKVKVKNTDTTKVTRTTTTPGGPTTTETTEHTTTHVDVDTKSASESDTKSVRIVESRPNWRVGALLGAGLAPGTTPTALVGPTVEFRIPSTPLWLGGWGLVGVDPVSKGVRSGAVGISLTGEF